jgi:hypothetical protein
MPSWTARATEVCVSFLLDGLIVERAFDSWVMEDESLRVIHMSHRVCSRKPIEVDISFPTTALTLTVI